LGEDFSGRGRGWRARLREPKDAAHSEGVALGTEVTVWSLLLDQFLRDLSIAKPEIIRYAGWAVNLQTMPSFDAVPELKVEQYQHHDRRHRVLGVTLVDPGAIESCRWHIEVNEGNLALHLAANEQSAIDATVEAVKRLFPEYKPTASNVIPMSVWAHAPNGPARYNREIEVPTWEAIRENYGGSTLQALDALMDPEWRPLSGGQLILWSGEPGTGKTWALRALGRQWKKWAELHYITDPDALFGAVPAYLLRVVMDAADTVELDDEDDGEGDPALRSSRKEQKWRVLVLEDSGELLALDAKLNVGQALSRLLNLVDGLLGQGLKTLVLVTTNEELGKLHPAVQRPGRCAANIKFERLREEEAAAWRLRHQLPPKPGSKAVTLAELYEELGGQRIETQASVRKVGFGA
jgi:hypothetical protein